jgi:hypothetical protein
MFELDGKVAMVTDGAFDFAASNTNRGVRRWNFQKCLT